MCYGFGYYTVVHIHDRFQGPHKCADKPAAAADQVPETRPAGRVPITQPGKWDQVGRQGDKRGDKAAVESVEGKGKSATQALRSKNH